MLTWEEIASLAAEPGKPAETLMNVVALIARRFGTDVCSAYLLEPDRANLVLAATLGLRPECVGKLRMAVNEGLAGLVAEQVRPVAVEQVRNHPRFKYFSEAGEELPIILGVPLIDRGVLQGVLVVQTVSRESFRKMRFAAHGGRRTELRPWSAKRARSTASSRPRRSGSGRWPAICGGAGITIPPALFRDLDPAALEPAESQSGLAAERISAGETRSSAPPNSCCTAASTTPIAACANIRMRSVPGARVTPECCGLVRSLISPPNLACTNRCRFIPADSEFWPAITSRARPI